MAKTITRTGADGSQEITEACEDIHSAKFSVTSKGEVTFEVKAYGATIPDVQENVSNLFLWALKQKRVWELETKEKVGA